MVEMLEHMSEYFYDFTRFIFASIRCTTPNLQTCEQFCCLLYVLYFLLNLSELHLTLCSPLPLSLITSPCLLTLTHIWEVLQRLCTNSLFACANKCEFH